jgi:hypothetical protein
LLEKELYRASAVTDIATEDGWLVPETSSGQTHLSAQLGQRVGDHVPEFDALERVPEPLGGVQLGRVGRQDLEVQALGRALG